MQLLTVEEASKILKVSKKTLYRWLRAGVIPYCKIGKAVRIKQEDLQELVENCYITVNVKEVVEDAIKKILSSD